MSTKAPVMSQEAASLTTQLPRASAQPMVPSQQHRGLWDGLLAALRRRLHEVSRQMPVRRPASRSLPFYAEPSVLSGMADWWGLGSLDTVYDVWPSPEEADAYALASDWCAIGADLRQAEVTLRTHSQDALTGGAKASTAFAQEVLRNVNKGSVGANAHGASRGTATVIGN